jgi:hypothetical protein
MIELYDLSGALVFWLVAAAMVMVATRGVPVRERRWMFLALGARILGTFGFVFALIVIFRGEGDALFYHRVGISFSEAMRDAPSVWPGQMTRLFLQQPANLPFFIPGQGTSTGTMIGLTSWLHYLLGPGLLTVSSVLAFGAYTGTAALFQTARRWFPDTPVRWLGIGTMLVPSVVFWTSGLVKEALVFTGLGWVVWSVARMLRKGPSAVAALTVLGLGLIYLSKPFVLVPLAMAGTFLVGGRFLRGRNVALSPIRIGVLAALGLAALLGVGRVNPALSVASLVEETARLQDFGRRSGEGSRYVLVQERQLTLGGQLAYAPLALFTGLYRPLIIEARSPIMIINGLETTVFLVLSGRAFMHVRRRRSWRVLLRSEELQFCLVYAIILALGVGLASSNLGTLSRYRTPVLPMWMMFLAVVQTRRALLRTDRSAVDGASPNRNGAALGDAPSATTGDTSLTSIKR